MNKYDRRGFLTSVGTGMVVAGHSAVRGIEPLTRSGRSPYRLSLAAYSLRQLLPNYRGATSTPPPTEMDMHRFLTYCAEQGLSAAEVTSYYLPDPPPLPLLRSLKRHAHQLGVSLSGGAIGNNFAHTDPELAASQMAYTERWLAAYAELGIGVVRLFAGQPAHGTTPELAEALVVERLAQASELGAKYGVMIALENHDFTMDVERYLRIVRAVASDWFGANLDTGNLTDSPDPYADVARIVPYAINVQIKPLIPVANVPEPADYDRLLRSLREGGYRGYVVLEYEGDNPLTEIPSHLERLQRALR